MSLQAAREQCQAARTVTKEILGVKYTLRLPPFGEVRERVWSVEDKGVRQKVLAEMLLESVIAWEGVTRGMLAVTDDATPEELPADRSALGPEDDPVVLLFKERPDIMDDLLDVFAEALTNRTMRIGAERKNFASTSLSS